MIILDEARYDVKKQQRVEAGLSGQGLSESSPVLRSSHEPPPEYTPRSSYTTPPMQYPDDIPVVTRQPVQRGENAKKRLCQAFIIGVLIWLLVSVYVRSLVDIITKMSEHKASRKCDGYFCEDGRIRSDICINGSEALALSSSSNNESLVYGKTQALLKFSFPSDSGLFLLSNDTLAYGSLVFPSREEARHDEIEVDIVITGRSARSMRHALICSASEGSDRGINLRRGLGVMSNLDDVGYSITVRYPPSKRAQSRLHVDLNRFEVSIAEEHMGLESIDVSTSDGSIHIQSQTAKSMRFRSRNSEIFGTFNISNALELETYNAPIEGSILSDNPSIKVHAGTHNAPATLSLPKSFLGRFILRTTLAKPTLHIADIGLAQVLPNSNSKHARRRVDILRKGNGILEGEVVMIGEDDDDMQKRGVGFVSLHSTMAPVTLYV